MMPRLFSALDSFLKPSRVHCCAATLLFAAALLTGPAIGYAQDHPPQNADKSLDSVELNVLGKKYPQLPKETRIELLEHQLHRTPAADASYQYRVSQILTAQQDAITDESRNASVRLYNKGIDEAQQNHIDTAITAYQQAIQLNPSLIPAYNNLANLQEKTHQYDAAAITYQKALAMAPKEALLHFNLAVILEKKGEIPEAYNHYRQYVQLSASPDPQIVELVKNFDTKRLASKGKPDYYDLTRQESHGEYLAWPPELTPVPVFIRLTDQGQSVFIPCVYQDFDTWTQVTDGRLRFREVGYPDAARIVITLKPGPLMDPDSSIGHASFNNAILDSEHPMRVLKINIVVNTGQPSSDLNIDNRKEQVSKLILHELGHAIGIWGHSPDPGDIMYTHPIVSQLSSRDIKTARKLYGLR